MYYVYTLGDYAGMTICPADRAIRHRYLGKKGNLMLVKAYTNKAEALAYERFLQDECGYLGGGQGKHGNQARGEANGNFGGTFRGTRKHEMI